MKNDLGGSHTKVQGVLCKLERSLTNLTLSLTDVHGKKHMVQAQTGDDGKVRVLTLPSDKLDLSPDALEEFVKLVQGISVMIKTGV